MEFVVKQYIMPLCVRDRVQTVTVLLQCLKKRFMAKYVVNFCNLQGTYMLKLPGTVCSHGHALVCCSIQIFHTLIGESVSP